VKKTVGWGWILLLFLATGTYAQTRQQEADRSDIRIVSSFVVAGEPVPEDCGRQAHVFAESLVRYPRPNSWHWVLVCDEAGWERFLRLSGRWEGDPIYASTDLAGRATYLRGAKLLTYEDFGVELDNVMRHELAHIRLNSTDEAEAEALSRQGAEVNWDTKQTQNTGN